MRVKRNRPVIRAGAAMGFLVALAVVSGSVWAQGQGGVKGSKHDLANGVNDNYEVCVYCHTPHGARTDIDAPLWNKPGGVQAYRTYDSATIDGKILPVGSVSTACLTCHDGTQAMDTVINAPGRGLGNGRMGSGVGALSPNIIANLGVDLRNDHPVGVQYGGFDDGRGQIDPDFVNSATGLQSAIMLGRRRWWVDTESVPNGNRDKTDMILYTRSVDGVDQPFVECATCHDPHRGSGTNPAFMRLTNKGSNLCLSCHIK
jgi:predicted CXXCH cytochrome family protein